MGGNMLVKGHVEKEDLDRQLLVGVIDDLSCLAPFALGLGVS